jgi:hypothetical protein
MSYSYAGWAEIADLSARLTALRQHISEVTLQVGPSVASGGHSRDASVLVQYLDGLRAERRELEARVERRGVKPAAVRFGGSG